MDKSFEGTNSLGKFLRPQERTVVSPVRNQTDNKPRRETAAEWISRTGTGSVVNNWKTDVCDELAMKYYNSRRESRLGSWRSNGEREDGEWVGHRERQFSPLGESLTATPRARMSLSSESSCDASEFSLTPPATTQDERGLSALKACYQQLLDLQRARCDYEKIFRRGSEMIPVFEPTDFTKKELIELMEFSEIQFKSLDEAIQAHYIALQPTDVAYMNTVWDRLCQGYNSHTQSAANKVRNQDPDAESSASMTVVCIQQLQNLMEAWKNFSTLLTDTIHKSIAAEGSMLFQESESVVILLQIFKTLVQDVQSKLVWGVCSNLYIENEDKENKPIHKMTSLPFRAEDPVQLPQIRFPPTRKQHCAPRYVNKSRK